MTDKERILAEIERLQDLTMDKDKNFYSKAAEGEYNALCNIKHFINSMQEEPVSEDLEKAAEIHWCSHPPINEVFSVVTAFKGGAKWKEQQMMEKAVDGVVINNDTYGYKDIVFHIPNDLKVDDKVKFLIIKQE